jgi:RND family efflux transporter MFP subunit
MVFIGRFKATIIYFGLILFLISCSEEKKVEEAIRPVRYEQVFASGGARTRTFSGVAKAGVESKLSFKVPGTVQRLLVKVGDEVRAGQLLAQLDPTDFRLQLQQAEAALTQAEAQARNAEASYERALKLYENRNIAKSNLDAARAAAESANAAVKSMENQLELAKRQLDYTKLTAPLNGAIAMVDCEINENVKKGETIISLTSDAQIEVKVTIPEVLIAKINEGDKVEVTFDALRNRQFSATVSEVGVTADAVGTAYPVTVSLTETTPEIRPGMAASVTFSFSTSDQREIIVVPSMAVQEDRQGRFVFVAEPLPDSEDLATVQRKNVTVGELTAGGGLEILEGLADGDRVITAGVSRIREGQKVKI